jgi:thymidylate kinase
MNKDSYPVLNIAIDGPDGSGKTTLIKKLQQHYDVISILKSSQVALMPTNLEERIEWLQEENAFVSGRIYYASHQARFQMIENFISKRYHYEMVKYNRFRQPPLIILDRGPLSAEAYTYASICYASSVPKQYVISYIEMLINDFPVFNPDLSICLLPEGDENALIERLSLHGEAEMKERILINGQIDYIRGKRLENVHFINCLEPEQNVFSQAYTIIQEAVEKVTQQNLISLKGHSLHNGVFYLDEILLQIQHLQFEKDVFLVGGLVQKGYTDNDVDFVVQCEQDAQLLKIFYKEKSAHFHIDLVATNEVSKLFGGKEAWYMKV